MKIRVLSDLHLEQDEPALVPHAPADLVVLAGDIHNHAAGLRWAAETFDPAVPVVYVPGNHEYYDGELGAIETSMRDAAASIDNVHLLNNATLVAPDGAWRVLGTTLWTDFDLFGAGVEERAASIAATQRAMLDFRGLIQVTWPHDATLAAHLAGRASSLSSSTPSPDAKATTSASTHANLRPEARDFTPADALALHHHARSWLEAELARPFSGRTIVVTHHAPHRQSLAPHYAHDLVSAGFVSDLDELVRAPVALWIHGHTHTPFDYTSNGTRVVCNPRGYRDRRTGLMENPAFAWDRVVEV